jgi:tetratricopeptide (TPR) repeat protein
MRRRRAARGTPPLLHVLLLALGAVQSSPPKAGSVPTDEEMATAREEYQLGRAAFETGDLTIAEPHFHKAAKAAPQFPEPHFALAQIMVRQGRHAEAQAHMAKAQQQMPANAANQAPAQTAGAAAGAGARGAGGAGEASLSALAAVVSRTLPKSHAHVGRALSDIAKNIKIGREAIEVMASSTDPQDVHNSRIHMQQQVAAEDFFHRLTQQPLDANLWWQLALNAFNMRREH